MNPKLILIIGICSIFVGFILPWLMVLNILEANLFFCFLAFGCMMLGMVMGNMYVAYAMRISKARQKNH